MARTVAVNEASGSLTITANASAKTLTLAANDGVGSRTVTIPFEKVFADERENGLIASIDAEFRSNAR